LRGIRGKVIVVLVGVVLAALGLAAANASAEVLVSQPPGPSGAAVPSDERPEGSEALDDFDVPMRGHWQLEAIRVFGTATLEHPRTFNVRIYRGLGGQLDRYPEHPPNAIEEPVFSERVTVVGGPNYLIPLEGAPILDHGSDWIAGEWVISVRAQSAGKEDDWNWLTGPYVTGNEPAFHFSREREPAGAETDLAFELLGTAPQTVKAHVTGKGTLVSNPPGISCPGICEAQFPRGTLVTFTANPKDSSQEFSEWGQFFPPCGKPEGAACTFTLDEDVNVGAKFKPLNEIDVLRVVRNRRAGTGELLVWVPGEGTLTMFSHNMRSYFPGTVPGGVVRIPLTPSGSVAKTLRNKGHATVWTEVSYLPPEAGSPTVDLMQVTLTRKRSHRSVHRPARRVH
jgi:hypothetical protein